MKARLTGGRRFRYAPSAFAIAIGAFVLMAGALLTSASDVNYAAANSGTNAAVGGGVPAALDGLMAQAVTAANTRRPAAFAPLTAEDAAHLFEWARGHTSTWQGDVLAVPSAAEDRNAPETPTYLAVFHAWHTCESDGDHVHRLVRTAQGWQLGPEIPETETGGFRVRDHDLHVALDFAQKSAQITDHVRIERTAASVPDFALLRLSPDFHLTKLTLDGPDGAPVSFRQVGGVIAFLPPAEKTFSLFMQYAGVVNHQGSDYITADEATLNSYWYPHIARLPATSTVTITVPSGWDALAPGERTHEQREADGSPTVTYRNEIPVCFFTLDAGRYTVTRRAYKGRTLAIYLLRPDSVLAQRCLDRLQSAMAFYEAHFGPFPYTRYAVVQTQGAFTGALEAYSFATFGPRTLPFTIPHELSHTWWGGLVPCTYTHAMWNESFADYSDDLFQRVAEASAAAGGERPARLERRRQPRLEPSLYPVPVARAFDSSDGQDFASAYIKGAQVLRALEAELGQETMLRCMGTFVSTHPRGTPAEWPDFEAIVHKVTGKDYRWFFAQWLERPALPVVWLANISTQPTDDGQILVQGEVRQAGEPYRLTMPVLVELRNGASVTATLDMREANTPFHVRVPTPPARLTLDPDDTLPLALPAETPPNADLLTYDFPPDIGQQQPGPSLRTVACGLLPASMNSAASRPSNSGEKHAPPAPQFWGEKDISARYASPQTPVVRETLTRERQRLVGQGTTERPPTPPRIGGPGGRDSQAWGVRGASIRAGGLGQADLCAARDGAIGSGLTAFLRHAEETANQGDRAAFAAISDPAAKNDLTWVGATSALPDDDPANTRPWRALSLTLPAPENAPAQTLIVFTKYHPCESQGDHVFPLEQADGQMRLGMEYAEAAPETVRLRSHRARITLEPRTGTLHAADRITFTREPDSTSLPLHDLFLLRLEDGCRVDTLLMAGHPVWFRQAGGVIAVRLPAGDAPAPNPRAPTPTLDITYHGRAAQSGEDFITPAEAALSGYWLPQIGRQPVTYDVALTIPRGWMAFTQGVQIAKTPGPGNTSLTITYRNALPVSYPSLAAGPYHLLTRPPVPGDPFGVSVAYLHSGDLGLARKAYQTAQASLHYYATHFSPFPYPRYTVVISDQYRMALEGYSITTIARSYVPSVLPHEISHTWWGGIVPNTYLHDMWNESFAEYSDGLYGRATGRRDSLHAVEVSGLMAMGMVGRMEGLSLQEAHDALDVQQSLIGYFKGSLVLETLEAMLGQPRMLACLRAFLAEHPRGTDATWGDFARAVTQTAGPEWKGFFDGWLPGRGVPTLRLENVHVERQSDPKPQVITAEITQDGDTAYWLNVPVDLRLKDGTTRTAAVLLKGDTAPVRFQLPADAVPESLEIDPQHRLLRARTPARATPTLTELLSRGEPLRVIYGTGGTEEERTAMREAAADATDLFPFAKVTVLSDAQALTDDKTREAGDVLVIGRPETNKFLAAYTGMLPVRFSEGASPSLTLSGQTFSAPDVWTFASTAMTVSGHEERNLLIFAGLSAAALRHLTDVRSLPGAQSVYVAEGAGKVLASRGPASLASTLYRFDAPDKP